MPNTDLLNRIARITRLIEAAEVHRVRAESLAGEPSRHNRELQKAAACDADVETKCDRLRQDIVSGTL